MTRLMIALVIVLALAAFVTADQMASTQPQAKALPQAQPSTATGLSQAQGAADADEHGGESLGNMKAFIIPLIVPTGIATLSLVALTVALRALPRRWKPKATLTLHKVFGILALICGLTHGTLIWMLD